MAEVDMDSSSSGSDSSSEMEEEINEEEVNREAKLYRERISANESDYDAHVGLVGALKKLGELEELTDARRHFSKIYPLSPQLWMQWLGDQQSICTTDEEVADIMLLFEKAVKDYINVPLWVEYILFMLKAGNHEATREIYEKALTAVGIHFADGILAWQAVMLVEQTIFHALRAEGNEVAVAEQKKRIQNLYRRQARVSLLNLIKEEFVDEASEWFDGQIDSSMHNDLEKSLKVSSSLLPFETALGNANSEVEKLEAYRKYFDFARNNSTPAFIQVTYERAVAELCLHAGIWEEYVKFAMEQFPFAGYVVLPICERSQRNCPWSSAMCYHRIKALQTYNEDSKDIHGLVKGCLEKALASGIQDKDELNRIWMSYLVYLRMEIDWQGDHEKSLQNFREACHQATDHIYEATENTDCEILRFLARIEAYEVKSSENVRTIYNEHILRCGNNFNRKDLWLEFICLERTCGNVKQVRKLFKRALQRVWEDVEDLAKEFFKFEQEVGTLETIGDFERRNRDRLAMVQKRRLEEAVKTGSSQQKAKKDSYKVRQELNSQYNQPTQMQVVPEVGKKMKHQEKGDFSAAAKRSAEQPESKPPAKKQKVESSHGEHVKHDSSNDYRSVFLSNLDYNSEREDILPIFAKCGEIDSFRLVMDYKGRSKGFGYLVFKEASSVNEALKCDRTPLKSRPLYVSQCDVAKSGHSFQYSSGLEKEKLFIRGLPQSMQEADIRSLFEENAKIKDFRLVTRRNGFSKGICFIQYYTAAEAEKVRAAMDGFEINGRKLTVLISNPSAKSVPSQSALQSKFHHAPEASTSATYSRGQKERLSFVPRSISTAKGKKELKQSKDELNDSEITSVPKTNEEFRKMLLK